MSQKRYFAYKLIPPRASFPGDMSSSEAAVMQRHVGYWSELLAKGCVVAVGPVADPSGAYGLAILEVSDEVAANELLAGDPALKADVGFRFELHVMPRALVRARTDRSD